MFVIIKDVQYEQYGKNRLNSFDLPKLYFQNVTSEEVKTSEFIDFCIQFVEIYNGKIFTALSFVNLFNDLWKNRHALCEEIVND